MGHVRPVRRNPNSLVSVLPRVRHSSHSPVPVRSVRDKVVRIPALITPGANLGLRERPLAHRDVLRRRIPAVNVTSRSIPGLSSATGTTVRMNPPCPTRTCLTRTASRASGSTITSPAATSPARIMASTEQDTTGREDQFHPGRECGMSGTWTAGNALWITRACVGADQGPLRLPLASWPASRCRVTDRPTADGAPCRNGSHPLLARNAVWGPLTIPG